jgi:hypothetical protein
MLSCNSIPSDDEEDDLCLNYDDLRMKKSATGSKALNNNSKKRKSMSDVAPAQSTHDASSGLTQNKKQKSIQVENSNQGVLASKFVQVS